jgi:hypothetical protein
VRQRGIDYSDRKWIAESLAQRDCERKAGETGTTNDHLGARICRTGHSHSHSL